jgi:AcrR family transcriptional regulator
VSDKKQATRRGRARRGDGDLLREDLLDAAEKLLAERGSAAAVSVRAIADAVGVTPPSVYLHFADKDDLLFEVCSRRFVEFAEAMIHALDGREHPVSQLEALGRAYIDWGLEHPAQYRILFTGQVDVSRHHDDPDSLPGFMALQVLIDVVERGMADGVFAAGDATRVAVVLWASVHGFVTLLLTEDELLPHLDLRGALDTLLAVALKGVAAPQASKGAT